MRGGLYRVKIEMVVSSDRGHEGRLLGFVIGGIFDSPFQRRCGAKDVTRD